MCGKALHFDKIIKKTSCIFEKKWYNMFYSFFAFERSNPIMTHQWMKILALLCALLMILTTAVACANDADGDPSDSSEDESTNNGDESGTTDKEPDTIVYAAKIPDGYSCNNESFVVYTYPQDVFVWKDYDYAFEWMNNFALGATLTELLGENALCWVYSFFYNGTYMLPETALTVAGAVIISKMYLPIISPK